MNKHLVFFFLFRSFNKKKKKKTSTSRTGFFLKVATSHPRVAPVPNKNGRCARGGRGSGGLGSVESRSSLESKPTAKRRGQRLQSALTVSNPTGLAFKLQ